MRPRRMAAKQLRRRWLFLSVACPVSILAGGVVLGGLSTATWSAVLLSLSSSLLVLMIGVIFEPHLTRRIRAATREVVREETEPLTQRILTLEELADEQVRQRRDLRDEVAEIARGLRSQPTRSVLVDAFSKADELELFDPHLFRVRTATEIDSPHLFFYFERIGDARLWLGFRSILFGHTDPSQWDMWEGPSAGDPVGIEWGETQSTAEIMRLLEVELLASEIEFRSAFSFAHAFQMLADSLEASFAVRTADSESGSRLDGVIVCVINAEWAITTHGLESLRTSCCYPLDEKVPDGSPCPRNHSNSLWDEALEYFEKRRESVALLIDERSLYQIANS